MVDIKGLDKARVMKALYEHSYARGLGGFQAVHIGVPTLEYFAGLLERRTCFEYVGGRVLNVDLSGGEFDERLYDRDCGEGAAQRAVDSVRAERDAAGNKEPSLEEQLLMAKEAIDKIQGVLADFPVDVCAFAVMYLRMKLPEPPRRMAGLLMSSEITTTSELFRPTKKTMGWPTGKEPRGRFG